MKYVRPMEGWGVIEADAYAVDGDGIYIEGYGLGEKLPRA